MKTRIGWLVALGSALVSLTASALGAEYSIPRYSVRHEQTTRGSGWPSHYHLSIGDIVARLRFAGMDPVGAPVLNGSTYVVEVINSDGLRERLVINATTGYAIAARPGNGIWAARKDHPSQKQGQTRRQVAGDRKILFQPPEPLASLPEMSSVVRRTTLSDLSLDFAFVSPSILNFASLSALRKNSEQLSENNPAPSSVGNSVPPPAENIEIKETPVGKDGVTNIVLIAAGADSERSGYEAVTIEPNGVIATDRKHDLFATCVAAQQQDKTGFVFLTNPPETIDQISYGDTLQVTGPPCARIAGEQADQPRVTVAIRKTGQVETNMAPPRVHYVIMGSILSPPAAATLADHASEIVQDCEYCPQLLALPAGSVSMGSSVEPSEQPTHLVAVAPFALSRYPVTVAQWRQCVLAMACSYEPIRGSNFSDTPVHNISFDDAQKFVAWLAGVTGKDYRLPTEAEFEYAARAGTGTNYWWGDQLVDGMANCRQCGEPFSVDMPVIATHFMPNSFGLYGVSGGVAQWVADCWHDNYDGAPQDGSAWISPGCTDHVVRGGSWMDSPSRLRAASRHRAEGDQRAIGYGLRVARAP